MKSIFPVVATLALLLASASLSGCKTGWFARQHQPQGQAQPSAASQATTATTTDMTEMCAMHRRMMAATTEAERDAIFKEQEHMKNISPEVRQQHIDRMRQNCQ